MVDAKYADNVVVITDCLVPAPNYPPSISMVDVDYVCVVDEIGNPGKFEDQVVGIIESRDGTIMDVVRKSKPYTFDE